MSIVCNLSKKNKLRKTGVVSFVPAFYSHCESPHFSSWYFVDIREIR